MSTNPRRIDVHHHLQPPKLIEWLNESHPEWTGGPDIPKWTPEIGIDVMDRAGEAVRRKPLHDGVGVEKRPVDALGLRLQNAMETDGAIGHVGCPPMLSGTTRFVCTP